MSNQTLAYYSLASAEYVQRTVGVNVSDERALLTSRLLPGARILDAGCGSGRDSKAFLDEGFAVSAFDGCPELCESAQAVTGIPVEHLLFQDLAYGPVFDGIWANASLLHLTDFELRHVLEKLLNALAPGGWLCASFKRGTGMRIDENKRFFNDMTPERIGPLVTAAGGELIEHVDLADKMGRGTEWISFFIQSLK